MSKLGHKKYGDKLELTAGEPVQPLQRIERVVVEPDGYLTRRVQELEEQLGIRDREEAPRQLTWDPGPLPTRLHGDIAVRIVGLVKARVPGADQRPPEAILDQLFSVIDRALIAEYGETAETSSA